MLIGPWPSQTSPASSSSETWVVRACRPPQPGCFPHQRNGHRMLFLYYSRPYYWYYYSIIFIVYVRPTYSYFSCCRMNKREKKKRFSLHPPQVMPPDEKTPPRGVPFQRESGLREKIRFLPQQRTGHTPALPEIAPGGRASRHAPCFACAWPTNPRQTSLQTTHSCRRHVAAATTFNLESNSLTLESEDILL